MRGLSLSTCEKNFIQQSFIEDLRIDKRTCTDHRPLELRLGSVPGSCIACLGYTKVMTRVSCEMVEPKETRPAEGTLFINVEMSSMGAPQNEERRNTERGIEVTRMLERVLKESGCVDMESLCIKAGEKVWRIRCDIHVLDDDGSLCDAASVSCITALAHFRRPDVTVLQDRVVVHSSLERPLVPLNLYHYPVIVSYGFTEDGSVLSKSIKFSACMIVDPTEREELCIDGHVLVGANKRQEICALHCSNSYTFNSDHIVKCARKAIERATKMADEIQATLNRQSNKIASNAPRSELGFAQLVGCARRRVTVNAVTNVKSEVKDEDDSDGEDKLEMPPPGLMDDVEAAVVRLNGPVAMSVTRSNSLQSSFADDVTLVSKKKKASMLVKDVMPTPVKVEADQDDELMIIEDQMNEAQGTAVDQRKQARRDARSQRAKARKQDGDADADMRDLLNDIETEQQQHANA